MVLQLHLTPEQQRAVERLAQRDSISLEEAVIRAVDLALRNGIEASAFPPGTPFHGLDDLIANLGEGPADLSTNRGYLDDLGR